MVGYFGYFLNKFDCDQNATTVMVFRRYLAHTT